MPAFRSMMCHHETHEISTQKSTLGGQFGRSLCGSGTRDRLQVHIFLAKSCNPVVGNMLNHVLDP